MDSTATAPVLSPRQKECLSWASMGKTSQQISQLLGVTPRTVHLHLENCRRKLGAENTPHAVAKAIRLGLIALEGPTE